MSGQPSCPPASGLADISAPPSWRCIDFISDLHLHEGLPRTFEAFEAYLAGTPADAVFILGDLFEAWVGDDMRHQPFEARCTQALARAGQRLALFLMVGNRDFLLGQAMAQACHARLVADPALLHAFGSRHLLTHGDAWCLDDTEYLAFRRQVRSPAWQEDFLAQPLPSRLRTAQALREASEARKDTLPVDAWADVDEAHAGEHLTLADAHSLVHGHTHRPGSGAFGRPGGQRHVLSDWDLDHPAAPRAEVLRLIARGFQRLPPAQAIHT